MMTFRQRNRLMVGVLLSSLFCAVLVMLLLTVSQPWGGSLTAQADGSQKSAQSAATRTPYTPPPLDAYAKPIDASGLSPKAQTLHNENYGVTLLPPFALNDKGELRIDFANPAENQVWLLADLRLGSNQLLLYRTGRIAPGQALPTLPLSAEAVEILRGEGDGAEVSLTIYSFEIKSFVSMGEISLNAPILLAK